MTRTRLAEQRGIADVEQPFPGGLNGTHAATETLAAAMQKRQPNWQDQWGATIARGADNELHPS